MTHNNSVNPYGGLGMPGAGFASRGKGSAIKRLNLASAPKVSSISEHPDALPSAPRTSRSHLLAGLRTAPKTPSTVPSSAPYHKTTMGFGAPYQKNGGYPGNVPHTAVGSSFSSLGQQYHSINPGQQFYSLPEQVLAPPPLELDENDEQMDPAVIAQLYATELYLAQRQQQLQQQLAQFHTAQQLAAMNINPHKRAQLSYPQTPVTPQLNMYNANGQIFTQEIAGQPGVYVVYNAVTGQSSLAFDPAAQQVELANSPPPPTPARINTSFGSNTSSPFGTGSPIGSRSRSPPKKSASPPIDVQPLPPPSANAFRRGHNRNRSSLVLNPTGGALANDGPRSAAIRGMATPLTGTFGPGQGRAGEHPIRQPAGPPPFEELQAKPTSKHEGSKNFATRQRRRALHTLVRAGLERRVGSGSPRTESVPSGSAGSTTPVSDSELTFSVPSDNDSDSGLSGQASFGGLKGMATIGSERVVVKEVPLVQAA